MLKLGRVAEGFYSIARFPKIIGVIDCTLIRIQSPGGDHAEAFMSRNGYFALNVQTLSDPDLKIRNIIVRGPGSCHDQTIFNNSNLKRDSVDGKHGRYILLGDSGCRLKPYLMTPLVYTGTPTENLYNEALVTTRNVVEQQYGLWKRRFPILSTGIKSQSAMNIIVATAILHIIAVKMHKVPEEWNNLNNQELNAVGQYVIMTIGHCALEVYK